MTAAPAIQQVWRALLQAQRTKACTSSQQHLTGGRHTEPDPPSMGDHGDATGDVNSNLLISYSTGDSQLDKAIWQWLTWDKVRNLGRGSPFSLPTPKLPYYWHSMFAPACLVLYSSGAFGWRLLGWAML